MDQDSRFDWDEMERQWDLSLDAADVALDEWFDGDAAAGTGQIDKVLASQRRQKEVLDALRDFESEMTDD